VPGAVVEEAAAHLQVLIPQDELPVRDRCLPEGAGRKLPFHGLFPVTDLARFAAAAGAEERQDKEGGKKQFHNDALRQVPGYCSSLVTLRARVWQEKVLESVPKAG
jgi:hypothetical protein